jgi:hypothetical protein
MFLFNSSCSKSDDLPILVIDNFNVNINENPNYDQLIGTIPSHINENRPLYYTFEILSQSIENAISIRNDGIYSEEPGSLFVNDETVFDFETNSVITAIIKVSAVSYRLDFSVEIHDSKTITAAINIIDLPE